VKVMTPKELSDSLHRLTLINKSIDNYIISYYLSSSRYIYSKDLMRKAYLVLLLVFLYSTLLAQNQNFKILGRIEGQSNLKYAFMHIAGDTTIYKTNILDNRFAFSGRYPPMGPEGMITVTRIFLSDADTHKNYVGLSTSKIWWTDMITEPQIDFVFDAKNKVTHVNGGALNKIQSVFSAYHEAYMNKVDSAFKQIDLATLDSAKKIEKKKEINHALYFEEQAGILDLINRYPHSPVVLFHFATFSMVPMFKDGRVRATFNSLSEQIKESKYGRRLGGFLTELEQQLAKPNMVNKKMPPFELAGLDGQLVKSTDLFGKYTLIDFWASWCAPCRVENPNINAAFDRYHKKGFNVIAISIDQLKDKAKWIAAIEKDKTKNFIHLFNPGGTSGIALDLDINAIPANFLLDSEGNIIATDLRGDELAKKLKELL
jgi:peroxiredoxin